MLGLFASIYLLPAAILSLGIWLALFALRDLGASLGMRRTFFVIAVTALLAPAVVPAGTILAVWVPNGLLLLAGAPPMLHDPRLVTFAAVSFASTAALGFALSWLLVRRRESAAIPLGQRLLRVTATIAAMGTMLAFYYTSIPDRRVEAHIDWALIETLYGESFDALVALGEITDAAVWQTERDRLERFYAADPAVAAVAVFDQRLETFAGDSTLQLIPGLGDVGCSSTGDGKWHHDRLMRCTREHPDEGRVETLKYRRESMSASGDELRAVNIEFYYAALMDTYTTDKVARFSRGDSSSAKMYDERVQGTWQIRQRFRATQSEMVHHTGTVTVGLRTDFGTYGLTADIQAESSLRKSQERFSRPECVGAVEVCRWTSSTTGTLEVRGNRALLVFDDPFWLSDRLDIGDETMVGRDDWGSATIYERSDSEVVAR